MARERSRTSVGANEAVEFFAGVGLVRAAIEGASAGWRAAWANDFDPGKRRIYEAWWGEGSIDGRDVREVRAAELPRARLWTASFPCTDLSVAGGRAGIHAGQSSAVWAVLGLLRELGDAGPEHILFENVVGLLSSHGGADLRALVEALNGAGFGVDPLFVDARWFTAQSRPRLFLIASRKDVVERADVSELEPSAVRPARLVEAMRASADLCWQARGVEAPRANGARVEDVLEKVPEDSARWWPRERAEYFFNQIHPGHRAMAERMIRGDVERVATAFRRVRAIDGVKKSLIELRSDGLAGCLRLPKGGSAKQMLFSAGSGRYRVRLLTARECGRLQGVELPGRLLERFSDDEWYAALGDAVCVPAARWAAEQIDGASRVVVREREGLFTSR